MKNEKITGLKTGLQAFTPFTGAKLAGAGEARGQTSVCTRIKRSRRRRPMHLRPLSASLRRVGATRSLGAAGRFGR